MIDIEKSKRVFDEFVSRYDLNDKKIKLKYEHTLRVCVQSIAISDSIGLSDEDRQLAYLIALLHDIGRFEQARIYNTFNDLESVDHADLGCKILFEQGLIREFISDSSYDKAIEFAIRNHNKLKIEDTLDERLLLHAKIIRDTDKLDIMNIVLLLGDIGINEDDNGITRKVREDFFNRRAINHKDKRTKNDSAITMLSFMFDLNFDYSYQYYRDKGYVGLFYERVKNKELFKDYTDFANEYIERKCNYVRNKI